MSDSNAPILEKSVAQPESAASQKLNWQAAGRALRHRNFQLFFSGQLISLIGTWMQTVAQSWLVYRLTGSGLLLGLCGVRGPDSGVSAVAPWRESPRIARNRQRIGDRDADSVDAARASILAALTLTHVVKVWEIIRPGDLAGSRECLRHSRHGSRFLIDMVGKEDLMNAIALNSSMFNGARVIGPAVAGILVARIGEGWCFFANGVSYIAVIIGLFMMRVHAPRTGLSAQLRRSITSLRAFNSSGRTAPIRALDDSSGTGERHGHAVRRADADFCGPHSAQWRAGVRVDDRLARSGRVGWDSDGCSRRGSPARSAHPGCSLGREGPRPVDRDLLRGIRHQPDSVFAFSKSFWLSVLLLLPVGYFIMLQMASSNTLIQVMVPDALRGRVMAVYSMMFMGMAPIGALLGGALSDRLGAPWTVAIGGLASMFGAWWFSLQLPKIRVEARKFIIAQAMTGGEPAEEMTPPVIENEYSGSAVPPASCRLSRGRLALASGGETSP